MVVLNPVIKERIIIPENECSCGNPDYGFNCVCEFVRDSPGDIEYSCEWHGLYTAGKPICNLCEEG